MVLVGPQETPEFIVVGEDQVDHAAAAQKLTVKADPGRCVPKQVICDIKGLGAPQLESWRSANGGSQIGGHRIELFEVDRELRSGLFSRLFGSGR
ncbi:MAG TPA: hypothetical protein DDW52_00020 [Planctomycetaceae bacterium]|nr:hypothetical protein [Planctomycetaceae bacterium]